MIAQDIMSSPDSVLERSHSAAMENTSSSPAGWMYVLPFADRSWPDQIFGGTFAFRRSRFIGSYFALSAIEIVDAAGGGEGRARRIDRDEAATQ